jgi:hypothetical protein
VYFVNSLVVTYSAGIVFGNGRLKRRSMPRRSVVGSVGSEPSHSRVGVYLSTLCDYRLCSDTLRFDAIVPSTRPETTNPNPSDTETNNVLTSTPPTTAEPPLGNYRQSTQILVLLQIMCRLTANFDRRACASPWPDCRCLFPTRGSRHGTITARHRRSHACG